MTTITFEGPIRGGGAPPCAVLRCSAAAEWVAALATRATGRTETLLCGAHKAQVDGGTPWRWDSAERVFLVGPDRLTAGPTPVDDYRFNVQVGDIDSAVGPAPVVLKLTAGRDEVPAVMMSRETAAALGRALLDIGEPGWRTQR
ncbi:hypothetical protein [Cellulomonas carbonis]|uniref:hypothetical protein n=1 Tax=Cellulomonas carbonis TaxID=1386092 RepID=UPI00166B25B2|nr:hypothetical protein [Cellulomonas carbonis]GGC17904.1 hypothetical protein GCM10010972_33930 [Cellulomonas carbonis]